MDNRITQITVTVNDGVRILVCVDSEGRAWELVANKWRQLPALPQLQNGEIS